MDNEQEKRDRTRIEFNTSAEVTCNGKSFSGPIINLSLKGIFVQTSEKPGLGTPVKVTIRLSGSSTDLSIKINAETIREEDNGIALEFKEMELDSFIHLRNIIFYADKELHEFLDFA